MSSKSLQIEQDVLEELKGRVLTDVVVCAGDDSHPPHLQLVFGDKAFVAQMLPEGMFVGLANVTPIGPALDGEVEVDPVHIHQSNGVLQ